MAFKDPYMLGLDVCSEGKHYMVMMLQRQRSHQQEHATAGQKGAAVDAVVVEGRRGKPTGINLN